MYIRLSLVGLTGEVILVALFISPSTGNTTCSTLQELRG
jgi:hypothetical protein